jgi:hypothetical protein
MKRSTQNTALPSSEDEVLYDEDPEDVAEMVRRIASQTISDADEAGNGDDRLWKRVAGSEQFRPARGGRDSARRNDIFKCDDLRDQPFAGPLELR